MNLFEKQRKQLLRFLIDGVENGALEYVLQEMQEVLRDEMSGECAVRAYLQNPEGSAQLNIEQRVVAMDKLLERMEVNFRTLCDLIRYQQLKEAGIINSVDEFLRLVRPDDVCDV